MNEQRIGRFALAAAAGLATACGGDGPASSETSFSGSVRDSAGVEMVENGRDGIWPEDGGWTTREVLTIGDAAGDADYQFGQIVSLDVMSDGRIAVLDGQARRIQIYGSDGQYERSIGGPGSGPGEFSSAPVALMVGRGDTIVVPDMGNQRITLIPAEGEASSFPLRIEQGMPIGFKMSDDGALISQRRPMNFADPSAGAGGSDLILEQAYDGTVTDTLLTPKRGGTFEIGEGGPRFMLFAPEPQWAMLDGRRLAYASNDAYRISVYGSDGALERIVTFPHEKRPVTESDQRTVRELMRRTMEESGAPTQAVDQMMGAVSFADNWPAFAQLRGGPGGTLWVQRVSDLERMPEDEREEWNPQLDQGAPEWDVFESDGRYGGVVKLPARFTPFVIEEDRIYGVFRDEFDIQYVRVYRLDSGSDSGDV